MADKKKAPVKPQNTAQVRINTTKTPDKPKKKSSILKNLLVFLLLIILLGGGFAAGVYLNFIDVNQLAQTYKLHEYPFLSEYFPKPQTNFETVPLEKEQPIPQPNPVSPTPPANEQPTIPEKKVADKSELDRQLKARQQEEVKKISKLARLYGSMKPDEAVSIMNQLEDDTVLAIFSRMEEEQVAKIMALFEAKRAARLTQEMIKVKPAVSPVNTI